MIISAGFTNAYSKIQAEYQRLRDKCDPPLRQIAEKHGGLFSSRPKSVESAFAKAQTGEFSKPFVQMTDIYAATIAVPVISSISTVCDEVAGAFVEVTRKTDRSLDPRQFVYDDLHLVLKLRPSNFLADKSLARLKFELQVKSLLQFAWTKATHESMYKAQTVSWQVDRLGAEARAALELLDGLLDDVNSAAQLLPLKENLNYARQQDIVSLLVELWDAEQLPADLRRCAQTIDQFLVLAACTPQELRAMLAGKDGGGYVAARSLTPPQAALGAILAKMNEAEFSTFVGRARRAKVRFLVTDEMTTFVPAVRKLPVNTRVII